MPLVRVRLETPTPLGNVPARGRLDWRPTRARTDDGVTVLAGQFAVTLKAGAADIMVAPTGAGWVWEVNEMFGGRPRVRYLAVPDVEVIDYTALIEVDPATLEPTAEPGAAWWAALDNANLVTNVTTDPDDPDVLAITTT